LINPESKPAFVEGVRTEYKTLRQKYQVQRDQPLLPIQEARRRKFAFDWSQYTPPKPRFTGVREVLTRHAALAQKPAVGKNVETISLEDLVPFIDWSPFFHAWEIRGRYPAILEDARAKELFDDAQKLLGEIAGRRLLTPRGVYGFFPANSTGDDVELYTDESRASVLGRFHFLRQQAGKPDGTPDWCLADFVAPAPGDDQANTRFPDYIGAFAVSAGFGVEELCRRFEKDHDDYSAIIVKALADRLAEAFAEYLHKRAREEWGFGAGENLSPEELIREKYRGIRPAAGYPACPDHSEKWTLWKLLDAESRTGIKLTERGAMWPGASVSGLYFSHPESRYFAVGKIGRDQVLDYQARKGLELSAVEKWLGPYLSYDPQANQAETEKAAASACPSGKCC
jgi:5-methyltetrahydrofolate--homocysteine methyltransferase